MRQQKDKVGGTRNQILVFKPLREKMMLFHDSLFGRHLEM